LEAVEVVEVPQTIPASGAGPFLDPGSGIEVHVRCGLETLVGEFHAEICEALFDQLYEEGEER
jgi:hypothetical protein